ncbi:hypothetical protein [Mycolicibacterium phlei]|uniref:hypothetical protein n=1 Tax=Mycolicibacterium phlei TaxID=1771 RepID=UPI0037C9C0FD
MAASLVASSAVSSFCAVCGSGFSVPASVPESDAPPSAEVPGESSSCANANPGLLAIAAPTPRATASAPTLPMNRA